MSNWYYRQGEKKIGPIKKADLQTWLKQGAVPRSQMVCREGGTAWARLDSFPELLEGLPAPEPIFEPNAPAPLGTCCRQHSDVAAAHICISCRKGVCPTCDFALPGNAHVCPSCVAASLRSTGRRRPLMIWSLCLAGVSSLAIVLFLSFLGRNAQGHDPAITIAFFFTLLAGILPAFVAAGLGLACLEKNLNNPLLLRMAAIWGNVILVAWLILFLLVGMELGNRNHAKALRPKLPTQISLVWRR